MFAMATADLITAIAVVGVVAVLLVFMGVRSGIIIAASDTPRFWPPYSSEFRRRQGSRAEP